MRKEREEIMKTTWIRKKGRLILACLLTAMLLVLTAMAYTAEGAGGWMLPLALFLSVAAGAYLLLAVRFGAVLNTAAAVLLPFCSMWLLQWYTCDPWRMYPKMILLNCIFFYTFYVGLAFLLGSFRLSYTIASLFAMVLGIANYFVIEFRSSPIVPWDLLSVGTAASVADNYTYSVTWRLLLVSLGFVFVILTGFKSTLKPRRLALRLPAFLLFAALLLGAGYAIQNDTVKDLFGMDQTLFTPTVRYRNNGFVAAFVGNLHLINVEEPDGYSAKRVEEIAASASSTASGSQTSRDRSTAGEETGEEQVLEAETEERETAAASETKTGEQMPNIIVIMDEAFSDLAYLGEFGTSEDYMPFFHSMMEEFPSGRLMVSVKGGNTANTEYEFLSGDTMAFLPAGSVVYQQYIKDEVPTLASYLRDLGYSTTAIHPYLASGWDRDTVYPLMGFEEFLDIDTFSDPLYIRNYISDESAFDKVIEVFENKEEGESAFIFEVTMQNHSGYSKEYPGFEESVFLTDYEESQKNTQIRAVEKYLTLIKASDSAFEKLIGYFETVEEPTVIVMFGDHQPSDYITNVISRLTGYDMESSLEEYQKTYEVPYVIWNNMGLELGENMELTSVNYLAACLLESLDLPLTQYQEFLLQLREELPVICAGAYIDKDGVYHSYSEEDAVYGDLLNNYNILQYNHLTDWKNRVDSVFAQPQS